MAGFGDFGNTVGEWAAATGETFNQEWYGAAPGEYEARMVRQAQNWKNEELRRKAGQEAELLRKQLEEQYRIYEENARRKQDDQRRWAELQMRTAQANFNRQQASIDQMRDAYNRQLSLQQAQFDEQKRIQAEQAQRREAERLAKEGRIAETSKVIGDYQADISNKQQAFLSQFAGGGGRFREALQASTPGAKQRLAGLTGTDDPNRAKAFAEQQSAAYLGQGQSLFNQWQQLQQESLGQIGTAEQAANLAEQQFQQQLTEASAPSYEDLTDEIGLQGIGQALTGGYEQAKGRFGSQATQARQEQQGLFSSLRGGAFNPDAGYETRRDTQLDQSTRTGFVPQVYQPNLGMIQEQYQGLNPIMQDLQEQYSQTYGDWNPEELQSRQGEATQLQQSAQQGLSQRSGEAAQGIGGLLSSLQGGLLNQGQLAQAQAGAASVNQQISGFEQGLMSQISNYYNQFSDALSRARTEFNTLKATRLQERSQLQGRRAAMEAARPSQQAERTQSRMASKQRRRVTGGGGSATPQEQLLSTLTRGNI